MIRERERETQLMISRDVRASAMEILAMFVGILFFMHRAWSSLLLRLWKSIAIELVVKEE